LPSNIRAEEYSNQSRYPSTPGTPEAELAPLASNPEISRTASLFLLLGSTALVAVCVEFLISSIDHLVENTPLSEAFIGLVVLPVVGNAAEHVTAVTVAARNKMDLAIGVAVGSSIQIALFITPLVVIIGWIMNKQMSLYFNLFETVTLFASAFIVNFLVLDGRSNYLEGALLCAAYIIIRFVLHLNVSREVLMAGVERWGVFLSKWGRSKLIHVWTRGGKEGAGGGFHGDAGMIQYTTGVGVTVARRGLGCWVYLGLGLWFSSLCTGI
jgi:hypothetical protein